MVSKTVNPEKAQFGLSITYVHVYRFHPGEKIQILISYLCFIRTNSMVTSKLIISKGCI